MTDVDPRQIKKALAKAEDLRTLNRWVYLLERDAVGETGDFAIKYGVDLDSLHRAKKIIAGLSEDLQDWAEAAESIGDMWIDENLTDEDFK